MRKRSYKQGLYNPVHTEKYKGSHPICYRSSWELMFMKWCDNNSNVVMWGSESIAIPYISPKDGRVHRYFVDNIVILKDSHNTIHKYFVEIKPHRQTLPPKQTGRKKPSTLIKEQYTYAVNMAKWEAAQQYCDKNDIKFTILTEYDLGLKVRKNCK